MKVFLLQPNVTLFCIFPWFWWRYKTWFWFSLQSHSFFMQLVHVYFSCFTYLKIVFTFNFTLRSSRDGYYFYSSILVTLVGHNSLINLLILRVLIVLELSFNREFYCKLPGLTDVYKNGKTIPGEQQFPSYLWVSVWTSERVMQLLEQHKPYKKDLSRPLCKKWG